MFKIVKKKNKKKKKTKQKKKQKKNKKKNEILQDGITVDVIWLQHIIWNFISVKVD